MNLHSTSPRSSAFRAVSAALLAASLMTGCGVPDDAALTGEANQGIDIRITAGSSLASAINRANPGDPCLTG